MKQVLFLIACWPLLSYSQGRDPMQYGRAYLAEGDNVASAQSYAEALRINPFDPVALNNLAVARAAGGDYQSARDLLVRAVRLAPGREDIRANMDSLHSWMESYNGVSLPANRLMLATPRRAAVLPEPPPLWSKPGSAVNDSTAAGRIADYPCKGIACR